MKLGSYGFVCGTFMSLKIARRKSVLRTAHVLMNMKIKIVMIAIIGNSLIAANGRGYEIVAEYEAKTFCTAQSYIRVTTLQFCTITAMFYSLC